MLLVDSFCDSAMMQTGIPTKVAGGIDGNGPGE
jgi:hypothetical protein